jgi:hypothetical protein
MGLPMTRSETAFSSPASSGQRFLKSKSCLALLQAKPIVEKLIATSAFENLDLQQIRGCPISRSFFARCGIPRVLTCLPLSPKNCRLSAVVSHISRKTSEIWGTLGFVAQWAVKDTLRSPAATPGHSRGRASPLPVRRRLLPGSEPCGRTLRPHVCLTDPQPSVERQSLTRRCWG